MTSPTVRLGSLPALRISPGTLLTVLLFAALMYPSLARGGVAPTTAVLLALGIGVFMIVSVLVHEVAHAVVARGFGASVDHIALTLWGGHTQYRSRQMSTLGSLLVSLSGPAANLLLAGVSTGIGQLSEPGTGAAVFFTVSSWLNLVLAVFNLLPGLPMDGGRALETLLGALLSSPEAGTRITAWLGRAIAVAVVAYPLWWIVRAGGAGGFSLLSLVWALLIAGMLWQGATHALSGAALQGRIRTLDAASLARAVHVVRPQSPLADLDPSADLSTVLILDRAGAPSGIIGRASRIDPAAAAAVPAAQRAATPVLAVAGTIGELAALPVALRGDALIDAMLARPAPAYLLLEEDGTARGVIMSADVNAILRAR
ncbi:peptidase [Brachybacterium avium]|uniref:Peptidase n=1 Tax=Brachybacterium avium TaxID=2017485 RepID=A0A220U9N4_9MICO|nr:site-2 protease family protein [Brachybacterium avium]ASK64596.1 peptidase [Brachybacterium avium]